MTIFVWAAIGYVCGSLPSAWLVAMIAGKRLALEAVERNVGEADAHLLLKRFGGPAATMATVLDVVKGFVPVLIAGHVASPYAVAACAVGAVFGHCWPPIFYRFAGRGLATASGTFLAFLPVEMVVAGVLRVFGAVLRAGGVMSTVGTALIPLIAWMRGQPAPYIVAGAAINVLLFARRLEGIEDDLRAHVPLGRAIWRRIVLDASARSDPSAQPSPFSDL